MLIWGDSRAQMLHFGIRKNLISDWQVLQIAASKCPAKINVSDNPSDYCTHSNWFALQAIRTQKPEIVEIGQNVGHNFKDMLNIKSYLLHLGVGKVIFTGPAPHWTYDLPLIIAAKLWQNTPNRTWLGIERTYIKEDQTLAKASRSAPNFNYISLIDHFCSNKGCLTYFGTDKMRGISTWDTAILLLSLQTLWQKPY